MSNTSKAKIEDTEYYKQKVQKKKYLKRYKKKRMSINVLVGRLKFLETRMESVRTVTYSDVPHSGIPVTIDDMLSEKISLEKRISEKEKTLSKIKDEVTDYIDYVDDDQLQKILITLFLDCCDVYDASVIMNMSERQFRRLYSKALNSLPDINKLS